MDKSFDAEQIERMFSQLARLRHLRDPDHGDLLESLKPAWLGLDAWDGLLEDLKAQRYREHQQTVRPRLVGK